MEETSAGVEINLEGMATFWRNLNLPPRLRTEVSVKLSIHLKSTQWLLLQADAVLVGEDGRQHRIHTFLLVLKFPFFRNLQRGDWIFLQGANSDVIELIVDPAYGGMNRFRKHKCDRICIYFSLAQAVSSQRTNVGAILDAQHTNI